MPAATNKADLIAITELEFAKLSKLLHGLSAQQALQKRDDDSSIKDVVGHRAHWIELFLGWYRDGQADRQVDFQAPGYKWNDLKRYNARLRADQQSLGWQEAIQLLNTNHARLMVFLHGLSAGALYDGPMKGAHNAWTTGRWAEAAGASHYRSAAKYIRSCKRSEAD